MSSDGPREVKHLWLQPKGDYSDGRGFRLWRFWMWFDLNADYGHPTWAGAVVSGFRMSWRRIGGLSRRDWALVLGVALVAAAAAGILIYYLLDIVR